MSDIQLRFNKDMLVLSSPIEAELARLGIDVAKDWAYTLMFEPELLEEAYKMESMAGAQCFVAFTGRLTPIEAAKAGMRDALSTMADNALKAASTVHPQHTLVEINPCGLPLDAFSKSSLIENRDQYASAAKLFADKDRDAFFLNGFKKCADLKCALMGIRKVSDTPVFASVDIDRNGNLIGVSQLCKDSGKVAVETIEDAASVMNEYGADVGGFSTDAPIAEVSEMLERYCDVSQLPSLVQLRVLHVCPEQEHPTDQNPYFSADTMVDAAEVLRGCGVQFLRASGNATPAYTGALVAATDRLDVVSRTGGMDLQTEADTPDVLADKLRAKVSAALGGNVVQ